MRNRLRDAAAILAVALYLAAGFFTEQEPRDPPQAAGSTFIDME